MNDGFKLSMSLLLASIGGIVLIVIYAVLTQ